MSDSGPVEPPPRPPRLTPLDPPPPRGPDAFWVWMPAVVTGVLVSIVVVIVHVHRGTEGTAAYRAGEASVIGVISAGLVGLFAHILRDRLHWVVWVSPIAIVVVSAIWYGVEYELPDAVNDVRAERNGQADYSLATPARAGEWARHDDKATQARLDQAVSAIERQMAGTTFGGITPVDAEYGNKDGVRLVFLGFNATGSLQDELRRSSRDALDGVMDGAGAEDVQHVDAGPLGGSMACTTRLESMPTAEGFAICVWTDASTVGDVTIVESGIDVDRAAEITRAFRAEVTRR